MEYSELPPLRHRQVGVQIGSSKRIKNNAEKRKQKANATSVVKRKRKRKAMGMSTTYTKEKAYHNQPIVRTTAHSPSLTTQPFVQNDNSKEQDNDKGLAHFGVRCKMADPRRVNEGSIILNRYRKIYLCQKIF